MDNYVKEGSHLVRRVVKLPVAGSTTYLYTLFEDNMTKYYRWLPDKTWEVIDLSSNLINVTALQEGDNVTITGAGTPADPYIINSLQDATGTPIVAISGVTATNVQEALEELKLQVDTAASPDGSETIVTGSGATSVSGSGTALDPYIVSSTAADGSETIVQGAGDIDVTGTGTALDPYIVGYNENIPVPILRTADGTLSATQIRSGSTSPVVVIPSEGPNTIIEVFSAIIHFKYGTVPFDNAGSLELACQSAGVPYGQFRTTGIFMNDTNTVIVKMPVKAEEDNSQFYTNDPVVLRTGGDSTVGDSTIDYYLTYRVIKLI